MRGRGLVVNRKGIIFIGLILFLSCKNEERVQKLSQNEMVRILSQIYIAEEKVNRLGLPRDSAEFVFDKMKDRVFKEFSTTDSAFKASLDYYWNHPDEMETTYSALVDSLNLKEQSLIIKE